MNIKASIIKQLLLPLLLMIIPYSASAAWQMDFASPNGYINALVTDNNGNLYVGGDFSMIGGVSVNNIAKWDGSNWSALGSGIDKISTYTVTTLAADSNGNLYAGGTFNTAGGVSANNIAKWDGNTWSALGTGTNNSIFTLAVDSNDNLYVAGYGNLTMAGGVSVMNVAKWNGSTWSALGSGGLNGWVLDLAFDSDGNLYAGGRMTNADGKYIIAKWDGSTWSELGNGIDYIVTSLATDSNGYLYVGRFLNGNVESVSNIAKWDGSNWSALDGGPNGSVNDLIIDNNGNLYVGGYFTSVGGATAKNIAKWNGSNWSALGSEIFYSSIQELAIDSNNNLYVSDWRSSNSNIMLWTDDTVIEDEAFTLEVDVDGGGSISSDIGNINCPEGNCWEDYEAEQEVELTAIPDPGYELDSWNGDCAGSEPSTTVVMNEYKSCWAYFVEAIEPEIFTLTISPQPTGGSISADIGMSEGIDCPDNCTEDYDIAEVGLTATADAGYELDSWIGDCSGSESDTILFMDSDKTCTASFVEVATETAVTLTISQPTGGTITAATGEGDGISCGTTPDNCTENYQADQLVTLTVTADADYQLDSWDGDCGGSRPYANLRMDSNKACTASFVPAATETAVTLTISQPNGGTITAAAGEGDGISCGTTPTNCTENYQAEQLVTLTATADEAYKLDSWSGDCGGSRPYANLRMDSDKTCVASFVPVATEAIFVLNISQPTGGTITAAAGGGDGISCGTTLTNCTENYVLKQLVTLTATPDAGYKLKRWTDACRGSRPSARLRMKWNNLNCSATFVLDN